VADLTPGSTAHDRTTPVTGGSIPGLALLFGVIYFVQGVAEPTEGLIAQPVRSLLKSWGYGTAQVAAFSALLALPWSLKPLYGLLSDFVPLAGYRRKSYLIGASSATIVGLLATYALPMTPAVRLWLFLWLVVPTLGVAFFDVVADALMVETGQPLGITGRLQSVQWASMYGATIATGLIGGYLSQHGMEPLAFLICALLTVPALILSIRYVREPRRPAPAGGMRGAARELSRHLRSPVVRGAAAFLFLFNFNPFLSAVLYMHMTRSLQFSEQTYGGLVALEAVASLAASIAYGLYCRRFTLRILLHGSLVCGIASTLAYWAMRGERSAVLVTVAVGFTYMTANLVQFDLAARTCPAAVAATVFALLMSVCNLSTSLATWLGGYAYDWGSAWLGPKTAFNALVGGSALLTAACWFFVPFLTRRVD
jgi:MFS family permease